MGQQPCEIEDDHLRLLALARAVFGLEAGAEWRTNVEVAAEKHGAACDQLWHELRKQVDAADGVIPALEHPSVKARKLAKRMRSQIVSAVQSAVEEALDDFHFQDHQ